ncbi:hypothetical protein ACQKKX_12820 [Neorhizobium sp. NPDC001467]|uniref:hypothetical protein n=1 Tax=Neorhizobium sp. NPDC001467 TaxID=3390595 RepID=UPI003D0221A3
MSAGRRDQHDFQAEEHTRALDVANSVILRFGPERSVDRFADPYQLEAFTTPRNPW